MPSSVMEERGGGGRAGGSGVPADAPAQSGRLQEEARGDVNAGEQRLLAFGAWGGYLSPGRSHPVAQKLLHIWFQSLPHTLHFLVSPVRAPKSSDRQGPVPLQTPKSSWARQALKLEYSP